MIEARIGLAIVVGFLLFCVKMTYLSTTSR